jgi:hypothetical protein
MTGTQVRENRRGAAFLQAFFKVYSNSGMMASCFFNTTHLEGTRKKELKLFSNAKGIPVMEV